MAISAARQRGLSIWPISSSACYAEEDVEGASEYLHAALDSYKRTANKSGEGSAYRYLAMVSLAHGSLDEARQRLSLSAKLATELGDIREATLCAALTGALLVR